MECSHCCAPSVSHKAAASRRPPWGNTHSLLIKHPHACSTSRYSSKFVLLWNVAAASHRDRAEGRTDPFQEVYWAICEKNAATHIKLSQVPRSSRHILHCIVSHLRQGRRNRKTWHEITRTRMNVGDAHIHKKNLISKKKWSKEKWRAAQCSSHSECDHHRWGYKLHALIQSIFTWNETTREP